MSMAAALAVSRNIVQIKHPLYLKRHRTLALNDTKIAPRIRNPRYIYNPGPIHKPRTIHRFHIVKSHLKNYKKVLLHHGPAKG